MPPPPATLVYLHGFASSPASSKARFFAERCAGRGRPTPWCPDLNLPDFATLTVTRMLDQVAGGIRDRPPGPVGLIGSSLGAFVAWHLADRLARTAEPADGDSRPLTRLVLMAPAIDFPAGFARRIGPEAMVRWRSTGRLQLFHHGDAATRAVGYALYEDGCAYESGAVRLTVPTLVFQGRDDELVDPATVEAFAAVRPNVTLHLLDDDHQLHDSLEQIWRASAPFLGLDP